MNPSPLSLSLSDFGCTPSLFFFCGDRTWDLSSRVSLSYCSISLFVLLLRGSNLGPLVSRLAKLLLYLALPEEKSSANWRCAKTISKMAIYRTSVQLLLSYPLSYLIFILSFSQFSSIIPILNFCVKFRILKPLLAGAWRVACGGQSVSVFVLVVRCAFRPNQRMCCIGLIFLHPLMHPTGLNS